MIGKSMSIFDLLFILLVSALASWLGLALSGIEYEASAVFIPCLVMVSHGLTAEIASRCYQVLDWFRLKNGLALFESGKKIEYCAYFGSLSIVFVCSWAGLNWSKAEYSISILWVSGLITLLYYPAAWMIISSMKILERLFAKTEEDPPSDPKSNL